MGPIDYSGMLTQLNLAPLQQALGQREVRQARQQQIEAVRQDRERQQQADAAWQADVGTLMADPSLANINAMMLRHPDRIAALREVAQGQTAAQRTRNVQAAMRLGGYLNNGLTTQARADLVARRDQLQAAGESTEITDAAIAAVDAGDLARARGIASMVIVGSLPDGANDVLTSLGWDAASRDRQADNERQDRAEARAERRDARDAADQSARLGLARNADARAAASAGRAAARAAGGGGGRGGRRSAGGGGGLGNRSSADLLRLARGQ